MAKPIECLRHLRIVGGRSRCYLRRKNVVRVIDGLHSRGGRRYHLNDAIHIVVLQRGPLIVLVSAGLQQTVIQIEVELVGELLSSIGA